MPASVQCVFMKNIIFILLLMVPSVSYSKDPRVMELENLPLNQFTPLPVQIHTFKNGLKLYYLENKELPVLEISSRIKLGASFESDDKKGLVSFMMSALRTGGTKVRSSESIDKILDQQAISIGGDSNREYSTFSLKTLIEDIDLSLQLYFEILNQPAFEDEKIEIIRERALDGIKRRNEQPSGIADREYAQLFYGSDNIWSRVATVQSVERIKKSDLIKFHEKYIHPNNILMAASGNISFKSLIEKIGKIIQGWPKQEIDFPNIPDVKKEWVGGHYIIDKDINQSTVLVGHFGEKRFNPDKYAITLANYVLGGSTFGSRLGSRIRTVLGLAYSVYALFDFGTDYGLFKVDVGTKSSSTVQVIEEIKNILIDIQAKNLITEKELEDAKKTILNQLIFQYEDPFEIVTSRLHYDYYGYPPNYLEVYQREVQKVSLADVQRVMQEYYFPDKLKVLIVGNKKEIKNLNSLGDVQDLPLDNE